MTTLDVHIGTLRAAVSAYPAIKELRVHTHLFHRLSIEVVQRNIGRLNDLLYGPQQYAIVARAR